MTKPKYGYKHEKKVHKKRKGKHSKKKNKKNKKKGKGRWYQKIYIKYIQD